MNNNMDVLLVFFICLATFNAGMALQRVTVFGASGGVGQQISAALLQTNYAVTAVSRNTQSLSGYPLLEGCEFCEADARIKSTLAPTLEKVNHVVISVGTTAFPTKKWEKGANNPKIACYDTVANILETIEELPVAKRPKKVILVSSIGVDRRDQLPFKILNLYGVLEQKRLSEELLESKTREMKISSVICRPGRLVGAPFTNFDLAKLLQKDQGADKGVLLDTQDVLAGDVERRDVAESIRRVIQTDFGSKPRQIKYSMINAPGAAPSETEWKALLSSII